MSDYADLKARLLIPCFEQGLDEVWIDTERREAATAIGALERERERFWRANLALQKSRDAAEARVKRLEEALRKIESGLPAGVMTFDKNHVIWRDAYRDLQRIARAALQEDKSHE